MKGYWIARVNIKNKDAYKSYAQLAKPAIEKYGGKYLARGGKQQILEGAITSSNDQVYLTRNKSEMPMRNLPGQALSCKRPHPR